MNGDSKAVGVNAAFVVGADGLGKNSCDYVKSFLAGIYMRGTVSVFRLPNRPSEDAFERTAPGEIDASQDRPVLEQHVSQ